MLSWGFTSRSRASFRQRQTPFPTNQSLLWSIYLHDRAYTQIKSNVHCGVETAAQVLNVHLGHCTEMASQVGRHIEDVRLSCVVLNPDQGVLIQRTTLPPMRVILWKFDGHSILHFYLPRHIIERATLVSAIMYFLFHHFHLINYNKTYPFKDSYWS